MAAAESFVAELGRVHRKWRARLDERLKNTGLTHARWQALLLIRRQREPLTQRELAQGLGIEGPTLVRTLDRLEQEGLIERCPADHDRRANTIRATAKARPIMGKIAQIADELRAELLAGISPDQLAVAAAVLKDIGDKLER
jgi:MarR family transcriptional regulator for hemolysin